MRGDRPRSCAGGDARGEYAAGRTAGERLVRAWLGRRSRLGGCLSGDPGGHAHPRALPAARRPSWPMAGASPSRRAIRCADCMFDPPPSVRTLPMPSQDVPVDLLDLASRASPALSPPDEPLWPVFDRASTGQPVAITATIATWKVWELPAAQWGNPPKVCGRSNQGSPAMGTDNRDVREPPPTPPCVT